METEEFWDDFARTYYEIQQETRLPIADDVAKFLIKVGILPTGTFADLAGGAGRYIKSLAPQIDKYELIDFSSQMLKFAQSEAEKLSLKTIQFSRQSVSDFLKQTPAASYDVIFSAMNPALTDVSQLKKLTEKGKKWIVILHMIENHDDVFSFVDQVLGTTEKDPNDSSYLMDTFEQFLLAQGFTPKKRAFTYHYQEEISRQMMEAYYEDQQEHQWFATLMAYFYQKKPVIFSTTTITYRLLYWAVRP